MGVTAMHRSSSTLPRSRAPGPRLTALAAAMLVAGCFDPDDPELTASPTTTSDGSTTAPPPDTTTAGESTTTAPGETTVTLDDTSTGPADTSTSGEDTTDATTDATTGEPLCGNGAVDAGEICDDAGESATCDADCTPVECGDTVTNATALEGCDDGNLDDDDACLATCQPASCGDGILWVGNETCDDANGTELDGCTNACAPGSVHVSGNANAYLVSAMNALGEAFTSDNAQWAVPGVAGVIILGHDGSDTMFPNYQAHLDAGGHLLLVGGSGDASYAAWANGFIANTNGGLWHQSSGCVSDWNATVAHPITALLPASYEFPDISSSYHMLHFTAAGQPAGTELLGQTCEDGPNNGVLATRRYPSGGTFTYMAFDIGNYGNAATEMAFVMPFLQGYLDYVRSPAP